MKDLPHLSLAFASILLSWGCASFQPGEIEEIGFLERAETRERDDLTVSVAIPSKAETRALFDSKLHKKKIQPIWVEIENHGDEPVALFPYSVDPDYFPPLEVAWLSHRTWATKTNKRIDDFYYSESFPQFIPEGATKSGFVFVSLDKGTKYVPMDILTEDGLEHFDFFVQIPGFRADYKAVDFEQLWEEAQEVTL